MRLELHELELLVNTLEVEAGINQAAVVYTDMQYTALANKLRWTLVRERERTKR